MDFPDSCTVENISSTDLYLDETLATPTTVDCRIRVTYEKTNDNIVIITGWIGFPPDTVIDPTSTITLPNGLKPDILTIKEVMRLSDNEIDYIRAEVGKLGGK